MSAEPYDPTEYQPDEDTTNLLDETEPPATSEEEEQAAVDAWDAYRLASEDVGQVQVAADDLNNSAMWIRWVEWGDAAALLARLRASRKLLQVVENGLETHIAKARIGEGLKDPTEVPGVGVVTHRRTAKKTTWDDSGLLQEVMHAFAAEDPDGQLPDVFQYRDLLQDAAAIGYWRVGALKKLGIDVEEYRKVETGRLTVDIQAGDN